MNIPTDTQADTTGHLTMAHVGLDAALHHGLTPPEGMSVQDLRAYWMDERSRAELFHRFVPFHEQYQAVQQRVITFTRRIAELLRCMAAQPETFGVDVQWRETQKQMLHATAEKLDYNYRYLGFEIPTGVGKSMLLGAYLRAFFEACRELGILAEVEAILFTSRTNLVLQLAGETFREPNPLAVQIPIVDIEEQEPNEENDEGDDQAVNWGDVKKWVASIINEQGIRLVTGQTGLAERQKDAALTVMTYQGLATIPQESLVRTRGVGLLIFDEAHRISQRVRGEIQERFPGALRLGGSATMKGPPSSKPFQVFQRIHSGKDSFRSHLAYYASLQDAIERKELKAIRCLQKGVAIDLSDVSRTTSGNLNQKELTRKMMYNIPVLAQFIRETFEEQHPVLELAGARPVAERTVIASVKRIAIAMALSKICNEQLGIRANWTSGFDNAGLFRKKIQALARRDIQILFSAGKLGEGLDVEEVDAVMSLWPYNRTSAWVLKQIIGRGMRLHEGDKDCLVIEPIFDAGEHQLATTPELFKVEQTYPGVLLAPAEARDAEIKIVKALNQGKTAQELWTNGLTADERASVLEFGWNSMPNVSVQWSEIPIVRNERYIKEVFRRKKKRGKDLENREDIVQEALYQLRRKDILVDALASYPSAIFAQMRFGPFSNGTALFNAVTGQNIAILVPEHMIILREHLSSEAVATESRNLHDERETKVVEAAAQVRSIVTMDLLGNAEKILQFHFLEECWNFLDSDEAAIVLMRELWREHDRLKSLMLDATDPGQFRVTSQLFKAAKLCKQFRVDQISKSVLTKNFPHLSKTIEN